MVVPRNVLSACLHDVEADGVVERLQAIPLRGRAGWCSDMAARCLERAGRHERLERVLGREAERWRREAIEEMKKW